MCVLVCDASLLYSVREILWRVLRGVGQRCMVRFGFGVWALFLFVKIFCLSLLQFVLLPFSFLYF